MKKNHKWILVILLLITIGTVVIFVFYQKPVNHTFFKPTPEEVMEDFYQAKDRAEGMLMDPLIVHAEIVAPTVIEAIKDKNMDKRRYAIGFLGNEKINTALPVLKTILENEEEKDYFRVDALESIYLINKAKGIELAKTYSKDDGFLGKTANEIISGSFSRPHRTYEKALKGWKD